MIFNDRTGLSLAEEEAIMRGMWKINRKLMIIFLSSLVMFGCGRSIESIVEPAVTSTPTELAEVLLSPEQETNRCAGLAGSLEMQVMVGPSEVVGMEPVAVGQIPFSVVSQEGIYRIDGGGPLNFDEQVFEAEWGTYTVNFSADSDITGECKVLDAGEVLQMTIVMDGEQMVTVRADGFQGDYPWSGTRELAVSFPVEESSTQSGEGWMLVLHLAP